MIREVEYLSQARAENLRPLSREAIISITGSGYPKATLRKGWLRVLRLVFDDIDAPFFNAVHFDSPHAEETLAWLQKVEGKVDKVYVHCHAGKSRSAAVAKFIAELYDIPGGIHVYPHYNQMVYRVLNNNWLGNGIVPRANSRG
jgi:predicted protein tyrosine phosphatase